MLYVAEIGSMHKGSPSLAWELIRQASIAGATICKFQFGWTKEAQDRQKHVYNEIRYIDPHAEKLKEACDFYGVELMASLWSDEGLETARRVGMKRYKIAHQIANDPAYEDFIKKVLADGKETFISDGWYWKAYPHARVLDVSPNYPAYPPMIIGSSYEFSYGYSDHSHGIAACLLAIARGANYVEKHFCLGKDDLCVRDTPFSADPKEFAELVRLGTEMERWR